MPTRRLLITRRSVPHPSLFEYDRLWQAVQAAASTSGVHAWRYQSGSDATNFIEFLEFPGDADPRRDPAQNETIARLDEIAPGIAEEWVDATIVTANQ